MNTLALVTQSPNDPFVRRPQPFGGNTLITGGLEVLFPMPFVDDKTQFRPLLFLDVGNVFNTECPDVSTFCSEPDVDELRYSVDLGVTWLTGLGPLTFGIAQAFTTVRSIRPSSSSSNSKDFLIASGGYLCRRTRGRRYSSASSEFRMPRWPSVCTIARFKPNPP